MTALEAGGVPAVDWPTTLADGDAAQVPTTARPRPCHAVPSKAGHRTA
jgi:hypothetical protein